MNAIQPRMGLVAGLSDHQGRCRTLTGAAQQGPEVVAQPMVENHQI